MANKTINNLTTLSAVVSSDLFPLWDASAAATRKATLANILNVLLGQANTFTDGQSIATSAVGTVPLIINLPAGATAPAQRWRLNSVERTALVIGSITTNLFIHDEDYGSGLAGSYIRIGRNTNATPGAGFLRMINNAGTDYRYWSDSTGQFRLNSADPTNANDTAGTVVGTQTSSSDVKNLLGEVGDPREALHAIIDAAKNGLRRFNYKSGSFNSEEFEGVVTDFSPRYGMDRDDEHPAGKSLNEIQLFGDLIRAVAYLAEKIKDK